MLVTTQIIIWLLRPYYLLFSRRDSNCCTFSKASLSFLSSSVVCVWVKITILKVIQCNEQLTSSFLFLLKKICSLRIDISKTMESPWRLNFTAKERQHLASFSSTRYCCIASTIVIIAIVSLKWASYHWKNQYAVDNNLELHRVRLKGN